MPISPCPVEEYLPGYLPAYLSNGVIGLRVGRVPQLDGIAVLNGFAGVDPESGAEAIARAPYPVAGSIELNGVALGAAPDRAVLRDQTYEFASGELTTRYRYEIGDVAAD